MNHPTYHNHHIEVRRSARYSTLGEVGVEVEDLWFVCHGYRQLAERFIRHFRVLADASRLVVAPEGLSTFYVDPSEKRHGPEDAVGATWMTRYDRESEIHDYVRYLDDLYSSIVSEIGSTPRRVTALGFSQGVHTISRWVALGGVQPHHLILWGSSLPSDLNLDEVAPILRGVRLTLVRGEGDPYATAEAQARQEERLRAAGIEFEARIHEGGHRMDGALLKELCTD